MGEVCVYCHQAFESDNTNLMINTAVTIYRLDGTVSNGHVHSRCFHSPLLGLFSTSSKPECFCLVELVTEEDYKASHSDHMECPVHGDSDAAALVFTLWYNDYRRRHGAEV